MDEAQSLLYQGVEELFAKAGAAEVMVTAFAQSVNQIYAVMGEEYGKSILDNTNNSLPADLFRTLQGDDWDGI